MTGACHQDNQSSIKWEKFAPPIQRLGRLAYGLRVYGSAQIATEQALFNMARTTL